MALGRGLGELLGEIESAYDDNIGTNSSSDLTQDDIDISLIEINPHQPRKIFNQEKLEELSKSIKNHGLLQPIVVTKRDDKYILIAGERRLRASKLANLIKIKAVILDIDDSKLREYALIENIQRDDLNILEIAYSYAALINEHSITHDELANMVHKSRSSITNILRLLSLSVYAQQMVSSDKITLGHAKVIISLDEKEQKKVIDTVIGQKLSVRETEKLVKELKEPKKENPKKIQKNSYDISTLKNIAKKLQNSDLKVKVTNNSFNISINSQEDIEKILKYFS
jgi:ParB family chromosome partitioning protein